MSILHCTLENGVDLYVNKHQKIRYYCTRSAKKRRKKNVKQYFTSRGAYISCIVIAMLYTHSIGNQPYNMMLVFKMHDSILT